MMVRQDRFSFGVPVVVVLQRFRIDASWLYNRVLLG